MSGEKYSERMDASRENLVVDGLLDERARAGSAALALIEEETGVRDLHRFVHCAHLRSAHMVTSF